MSRYTKLAIPNVADLRFGVAPTPFTTRQRDRIRKPLLVVHGRNDPRVPYTEAEQIVETVRRNGVPVWYILARDDGGNCDARSTRDNLLAADQRRRLDSHLPPN